MTPNPISLRQDATIANAIMLFTDRALTGASVIDERGSPIRVSSSADVLIHDLEHLNLGVAYSDQCAGEALSDRMELECMESGYHVVPIDHTTVGNRLTSAVFSVRPGTSARKVLEELVNLHVHRMFVLNEGGVLVGVISALDVMSGILGAI